MSQSSIDQHISTRNEYGHTSKLLSVDRFTTGTVTLGEVTALKHEVWNYTMEGRTLVSESVLASRELTEVFRGLGNDIVVQLEDDPASRLVVNSDIELRDVLEAAIRIN